MPDSLETVLIAGARSYTHFTRLILTPIQQEFLAGQPNDPTLSLFEIRPTSRIETIDARRRRR